RAEVPNVAVAPGNARQSAAAQNSAQPRSSSDVISLKLVPSPSPTEQRQAPTERRNDSYHAGVIKWYPGDYVSSRATCCSATKSSCITATVWRKCLMQQVPCCGTAQIARRIASRCP